MHIYKCVCTYMCWSTTPFTVFMDNHHFTRHIIFLPLNNLCVYYYVCILSSRLVVLCPYSIKPTITRSGTYGTLSKLLNGHLIPTQDSSRYNIMIATRYNVLCLSWKEACKGSDCSHLGIGSKTRLD